MRTGAKLSFGGGELMAEVVEELPGGNRLVRFDYEGIFLEVLERLGKMPLPPYQGGASGPGALSDGVLQGQWLRSRPTAGLHFTQELLDQVSAMGVKLGIRYTPCGPGDLPPGEGGRDRGATKCTVNTA